MDIISQPAELEARLSCVVVCKVNCVVERRVPLAGVRIVKHSQRWMNQWITYLPTCGISVPLQCLFVDLDIPLSASSTLLLLLLLHRHTVLCKYRHANCSSSADLRSSRCPSHPYLITASSSRGRRKCSETFLKTKWVCFDWFYSTRLGCKSKHSIWKPIQRQGGEQNHVSPTYQPASQPVYLCWRYLYLLLWTDCGVLK